MHTKAIKIRFRGYLTFADSLKVQRVLAKRWRVSPFMVISVVTFAATAFLIYRMQVGIVFGGFLLVFMAAFMYGGLRMMRRAADRTQQRVYEKACRKRTGMLTETGITIRKDKTVRNIPWHTFDRAAEIDGIVAVMKGTETLGFAKYMFDAEADWHRAKALILKHYR